MALSPGDGDSGIWSGCAAVSDEGEPLLFYTSASEGDVGRASIRVARPADPELRTRTKGPVVASPQRPETTVFRDPVITRDADTWRMVVGHGDAERTAGAEVFRSADLLTRDYDGLLSTRAAADEPFTGAAWECPQLVRRTHGLDTDLLVVSVWDDDPFHVAASAGTYSEGRFTRGTGSG
ncbi:glycoside hydrolase family 32 protein [Nocardioides sp. B-3]|uniref:glycoside hydrolase family 32 protein n=1 Tax=Nocardioides sp. B-3 TaxID=2895565 RepID=UPI002152601D|nr:glycoside hydrolase family 32 protein [Nocardioides sp. B-3]